MRIRQTGFTLIEMVITIVILGILGSVAAYGIQNGVIAFQSSSEALDTLGKLRVSTERIARELREIRRDPLDSSRYEITEPFSATQIGFVKNDGTSVIINAAGNSLTLEYDAGGAHILTDQVSGFTLIYYGSDASTSAGSADAVAFIELELVLVDGAGNSLPQQTRIALRGQP